MSLASTETAPWPLPGKANEWAYVTGLFDTSNPSYPLIADGFVPGGTTYSPNENDPGGVWKGQAAIVVFCDDSAKIIKCNSTYQVPGSPNGQNLFDTSGQSGAWMGGGSANTVTVVNPLQQ
jgi:hypothetical protein